MHALSERFGRSSRFMALGAAVVLASVLAPLPAAHAQTVPAPIEQTVKRRLPVPKPLKAQISAGHARERIHVKLQEGTSVRLRGSVLASLGNDDLRDLHSVLSRYPGTRIDRLFTRSESDLTQEKTRIESKSKREQADKNLYYRLVLAPGTDAEALIDDLNQLDIVELAYAEPLPAPPPVTASSFVGSQGYLDASSDGGIDADFARTQTGGDGRNVRIFDIEYSWNRNHEDLAKLSQSGAVLRNRTPSDPFSSNNHGTAVVGELVGDSNAFGITGIVPGAGVAVVNSANVEDGLDIADAIDLAHANATAGDVIIIEQQTVGANGGCTRTTQVGCVPVEWVQATYDAIVAATSDGVIVVEPAGNGSQNLDDTTAYGDPFPAGRPDSGAIIVGAGAAPDCTAPVRGRLSFSTFGSRVDVQGWGECVFTAGYGDYRGGTDANAWYTDSFSGTSSATPIVAGAAAAISSIVQGQGRPAPSPERVRAILRATGAAQDISTAAQPGHIGPLPNLRAAVSRLDAINFELLGVPANRRVYAANDTTGRRTLLQRDADGAYRGTEVGNLSGLSSVSYHYEIAIGVEPVRTIRTVDQFTRAVTPTDRSTGEVQVTNSVAAAATAFNPPSVALANQRQTWTATFSDSFGGAITTPRLNLVATDPIKDVAIGQISYDVPSGKVCLLTPPDGQFSCAAHNAGGSVQNQYVRVDVAGTNASASGKNVSVTWAFTVLEQADGGRYTAHSSMSDLVGLEATRSDSLGITHQPRTGSLNPNSGFRLTGGKPSPVVATFSDPDGADELKTVTAALTDGVSLSYSADRNRLYVSDEPVSLNLGCAPGDQSKTSIRTASVSLNCADSVVRHADGETLEVTWQVAFLDSLAGRRYTTTLRATDSLGADSGTVAVGSLAIDRAPRLVSLTPASGSQAAGAPQAFTAIVDDPDAVSEVNLVELRLNGLLRDIVVRYSSSSNKLMLLGDDGKSLLVCAPGEAKVLRNTAASLDCAASTAVVRSIQTAPRDLAVTWLVTPSAAVAGSTFETLVRATDDVGAQTGPQAFGTWRVNN